MSDIPFTSFGFKATGSTTNRTMPERLAEVKNVLDFGGDNSGSGDSAVWTATRIAIQAAYDAAIAEGGGIVFFPQGNYRVDQAVQINDNSGAGITFIGASGTLIQADYNGFIFERYNVDSGSPDYSWTKCIFEKLDLTNPNTGSSAGCIRIGSCGQAAFRDCHFQGQKCITTEDSPGNSSQNITIENCKFTGPSAAPYLAEGIICGGSGYMSGCDFVGLYVGARIYGSGMFMTGCRAENSHIGYLFGLDSADTDQGASGFTLLSSTEGDVIGIHLAGTCSGFVISGGQLGHDVGNSGYPTYPPEVADVASTHGILVGDKCSNGLFLNNFPNQFFTVAGFEIAAGASRKNLVFRGNTTAIGGGGGVAWILPDNAYTASFKDNEINPTWTVSQLGTGGNAVEGDEATVTDGTNGLAWGATVTDTGSHTSHYFVRYNGTNWTVVGK